MADHDCACLDCRGVTLPSAVLDERHFSVDDTPQFVGRCVVTLDDVQVQHVAFAGRAGDDGWVARYLLDGDGRRHACVRCRDSACADVVTGRVSIRVFAGASS